MTDTPPSELPRLQLKPREEKRLRGGHVWIFSNEVDTDRTPLKSFEPGDQATVVDAQGKPLGNAYVNPHSLIAARLFSRETRYLLDRSLIVHRLNRALSLRQRYFAKPYYRLVFGESDGLPGLVVDRFGDVAVVQINTAGMERAREAIVDALRQVIKPTAILLQGDSGMRQMEALPSYREWVDGNGVDPLRVEENELQYEVDAMHGQKTGWFYDHRENRRQLAPLSRDARVLDLFSYAGAWGMNAAHFGAAAVTFVDSSEQALDWAERSAGLNGFADKSRFIEGDAFAVMEALKADGERFDLIIADPPAFIKRRKDYKAGLQGYRKLHQAAIRLLDKDGMLVAASCSSHLSEADFTQSVLQAARHVDRMAQVVQRGRQSPDHPIQPAIPETEYLKCLTARIARNTDTV